MEEKGHLFGAKFFFYLLVCFVVECIEYKKNKQLRKNASLWIFFKI
jgi:hypothetical protein